MGRPRADRIETSEIIATICDEAEVTPSTAWGVLSGNSTVDMPYRRKQQIVRIAKELGYRFEKLGSLKDRIQHARWLARRGKRDKAALLYILHYLDSHPWIGTTHLYNLIASQAGWSRDKARYTFFAFKEKGYFAVRQSYKRPTPKTGRKWVLGQRGKELLATVKQNLHGGEWQTCVKVAGRLTQAKIIPTYLRSTVP